MIRAGWMCCLSLLCSIILCCHYGFAEVLPVAAFMQEQTATQAEEVDGGSLLSDMVVNPSAQDEANLRRAQVIANSVATVDWLGALSPIALSPFFGMACLTGVATYGPDWLKERSSLFSDAGPLANPYLFWSMAVLTIVTSLPRLSKVSKPIALVADRLESYSVILILVCIRLFGSLDESAPEQVATLPVYVAGIASLPVDILLAIFAGLNLIVVGTIKLFFEFLVWLTPVPTLDALFEAANKTLSGAFAALYCFSPFAAAVVDLTILILCSMVFFWVSRRVYYYIKVLVMPWFLKLMGKDQAFNVQAEPAFLASAWRSWPLYTEVRLTGSEAEGWSVSTRRFGLLRRSQRIGPSKLTLEQELLRSRGTLEDGTSDPLSLYFRK